MDTQEEQFILDAELRMAFLDESLDALQAISPLVVQLESAATDKELVNSIFRPIHSIKGNAAFFGFHKLRAFAHELESLLAMVRDDRCSMCRPLADVIVAGTDEVGAIIERLRDGGAEIADQKQFDFMLAEILRWKNGEGKEIERVGREYLITELREMLESHCPAAIDIFKQLFAAESTEASGAIEPSGVVAAVEQQPKHQERIDLMRDKSLPTSKMMRVKEDDIDGFLASIGELLELGESLATISDHHEDSAEELQIASEVKRVSLEYAKLLDRLQESVMCIRNVSVKTLFGKVPKIVRDVARVREKQVEVELIGEELSLDKSILEVLDAPLVHIIRNAVDHGIELPERRVAAGKHPVGRVRVKLEALEKKFVLTVQDDGGGINLAALSKKAESLGIIQEGERLDEERLVELIFAAGVSTADSVTDISGRGVGMDVVKRQVEDAGGRILISTNPGEGSCFTIELPKSITTQIISGLTAVVRDQFYVFPTDYIQETFVYSESDIVSVCEGGRCVFRHDGYIPVFDLSELLGYERLDSPSRVIVSVQTKRKCFALIVDEVRSIRNVVVKKLSSIPIFDPLFRGASIAGNGPLALVLDCDHLADRFLADGQPRSEMSSRNEARRQRDELSASPC